MFRGLFRAILSIAMLAASPAVAAPGTSPETPPPGQSPTPATIHVSGKPKGDWLNPKLAFATRLGAAAEERAHHQVVYDGTGYPIAYPMGDVPAGKGTCTDEVIRAYRLVGVDLQQVVHEDMLRAFALYPTKFGLKEPDANIDHRRVWNLLTFFQRNAESLPITEDGKDYKPGDVIIWDLDNYQLHIGLVTRRWSKGHKRPLIMHNISSGPHVEDKLFEYKILGHFRYEGGLKPEPTPAAAAQDATAPTPAQPEPAKPASVPDELPSSP